MVRKVAIEASDDGVQHLVFSARFENLEMGNMESRRRAAAFESKPLELIAIAPALKTLRGQVSWTIRQPRKLRPALDASV